MEIEDKEIEIKESDLMNKINTYTNDIENKKIGSIDNQNSSNVKKAQYISGSGNSIYTYPKFYSPRILESNINLPKDLKTQNAWNRIYYATNPIVRCCINTHATCSVGKFNIECEDSSIKQFFEDMLNDIDIVNVINNISIEFWKMGEAFPYLQFDNNRGTWSYCFIHNPDYIVVKLNPLMTEPLFFLIIDESLKNIINSKNIDEIELLKSFTPREIEYLRKSNMIPLEPFNISHIKMTASPYDIRGTSLIASCYRDLMLYDKIREAKIAQADSLINPITIFKLGDPNGNYKPTDEDIRRWAEMFYESYANHNYTIFTHGMVSVERLSASGQTLDMSQDLEMCVKNIMTGLLMPTSLLDQDYGSYANSSVALEVLISRYEYFRNSLKRWIEKKVFEPIARVQDFYRLQNGTKRLIYPRVRFEKIHLKDTENYLSQVIQYVGDIGKEGKISIQTLYEALGIDYNVELKKIRKQMIDSIIIEKEREALTNMDLNELRTLTPETVIVNNTDLNTLKSKLSLMNNGDDNIEVDQKDNTRDNDLNSIQTEKESAQNNENIDFSEINIEDEYNKIINK